MTRPLRTLLLSALALGALATAAAATPSAPPPPDAGMAGMAGMAAMHAVGPTHAEYDLDIDQMRQWHETDTSVARMHEMLVEQGVDVDAMQADCPMPTDASMGAMHRDGAHHDTPGGE